jgi:epoxyqueuosine reductase
MSHDIKRRDFFRYGLEGSALVAGSAVAAKAVTNDDSASEYSARPWWVKEVDSPPYAVDEKRYQRFDQKKNVFGSMIKYVGGDRFMELQRINQERGKQYIKEGKPGYRIEDRALANAARTLWATGGINQGMRSWTGTSGRAANRRRITRYEGSPQEAANLVKKAGRYFGAALTGIAPLDRRHIFAKSRDMEIVFEPVDIPYEVKGEKLVIPVGCRYAVAVAVQMSLDTLQCTPTAVGAAGTYLGYSRLEFLVGSLAEFIRNLGYVAIPSMNDLGASVPIAIDAGLGELGRTNRLVTPEYGHAVRLGKILTDLPMTTDKPIRFGMREFCMACRRCAEACPANVISTKDGPDFEVQGEWSNPGHEGWFENSPNCLAFWRENTQSCSICVTVCPWTKKDKTLIHDIVKAASAEFPGMAGVYTTLDKAFGYGEQKDSVDWWNLDLPEYGIDTTQGKG